ncbi:MAG: glutamate--tRNA ligase [Bacteroidetes bacterium]|nr:glutamate--tRNA ligase [Bacteroidota bacterium]
MEKRHIRVRFAPSPTGPLHIGGVRTALYNFLFARKHGGTCILRIEDTDQNRFVPGAEAYIAESFKWCGIAFDESPEKGGPFAPYRQSDRKTLYRDYAESLVEKGFAYYAFDSEEELEKARQDLSVKGTFQYDGATRKRMKNSLTIPPSEVQELLDSGKDHVIRLKIQENEEVRFHDLIRGEVVVHTANLDDKVLFKSDGWPTYHLANVVDDHLMEISHVIRGEEWLPSAPLHVLLYRAFGWEMPEFAHLPLLLKPDGNGKLSKRDGDKLGFPVFPLQWKDQATGELSCGYRESGYLPEAFINMLAFLGWNPGTTQELFSMDEMIQVFSLEHVGKSGSRFDPAKARWFNHQYMLRKNPAELAVFLQKELTARSLSFPDKYVESVSALIHDRAELIPDLWKQSWFFFKPPESYDEETVKKKWKPETPALLTDLVNLYRSLPDFSAHTVEAATKEFLVALNLGMGQIMNPLRLCVVGSGMGPGMFDIAALLGIEEIIRRIEKGIQTIKSI